MKSNVTPIGNRVLLRRVPAPDKTPSGIFIPEEARVLTRQAKVIAIGDKVEHIKPGDEVMLPDHGGTPVTIGGEDLMIMSPSELLAKITRTK